MAIAVQVVVILTIVFYKLVILGTGTEVALNIRPVDPRDPLRGDYVTFQYDISQVYYDPYSQGFSQTTEQRLKMGDTVYVLLYKSDLVWYAGNASLTKPKGDAVFIKGRVIGEEDENRRIHVQYGIEDYFIPEGKGTTLPASLSCADSFGGSCVNGNYAVVVVDEQGEAVLKKLYIHGKPWP